jgi:intein/homing endonuclease
MKESFIKYLAGLLDADGSLSFGFKRDYNRDDTFFISLQLKLTAADSVDRNGFVESLPFETGMGTTSRYGKHNQYVVWNISKRSSLEMIIPRLTKHMIVKGKHWYWMFSLWRDYLRGEKTFSSCNREMLTQAVKESRKTKAGPIKPKNHVTWAWLAGYLDGDGCYSYRSGKYKSYRDRTYKQWTIKVTAIAHITDICVLEMLKKCFGGRVVGMNKSSNVMIWERSLGYQNRSFALNFLPKVAKHSRLKRYKIDQMIHHHRQRLSVPGVTAQAIV